MSRRTALGATGLVVLTVLGATPERALADSAVCVDCLQIRVGPATVIRGPFPDELDAPFAALRLADGSVRGFSANGSTYAIDGTTLWDMAGPRQEVLRPGAPGSINDCGRWLTAMARSGETVVGLVHQERACDYERGRTEKSMAIATSSDEGLSWTDLGTVITGRDLTQPDGTIGEGDCTMVDGLDGYLYAYCQRNSDWQTIVARAPVSEPTTWHKYYQGSWSEPGLGGQATAIGFIGPGAGYLLEQGWVAALSTDPWFGGLRLAVSADKVSFTDLKEPLLPVDGAEWNRPAATDLVAYSTLLNPDDGSNAVNRRFVLAHIHVPAGLGFESRYLVLRELSLSVADRPVAVQVGLALSRWSDAGRGPYVSSTGPLTGERQAYRRDATLAYMLTRAPEGVASVKLAECSRDLGGYVDQMLAEDGSCAPTGYAHERTAGWLYAAEQPGSVPVYRCIDDRTQTHFASGAADCEGLGAQDRLLGYGLAS